jgi:hypothetical protein
MPKGGGAIQGIGEKFETNPVTGTYSMSVPLAISPGRSGFAPQLALSYNSGGGNSPFGLGWGVGIPNITRKTDKRLPKYFDESESDVYILSGAEDLVPEDDGTKTIGDYTVKSYIPRTEGLFARIERWRHNSTGDIHWRTISKENITSLFGQDSTARITDPNDNKKIFSWYLQKTFDAKGNLMIYHYKKEDAINTPGTVNEINKKSAYNNIYIDKIEYGNTVMYNPDNEENYKTDWLFTLAFDYGNWQTYGNDESGNLTGTSDWDARLDPFSVFKPGFEIRTYRLCKRVLMFHNFSQLKDQYKTEIAVLVKSTDITYSTSEYMAQITSVLHTSYDGDEKETLPAATFEYSKAEIGNKLHKVSPEMLGNVPGGSANADWQWTDLYGEGISSLLKCDNNAWYYVTTR